jgi:putative mRNA 3-end processing factor
LGKAQRVLAGLLANPDSPPGPIYTHGAVEKFCRLYREAGVALAPTTPASDAPPATDWSRALILAPPGWTASRRFGPNSTGFVSGWMRIRGARRRRSLDRGFVLSDHADWPGILSAIRASGAQRVWVTHGYRAPVVEWLRHQEIEAHAVETRFESEQDETGAEP